MNLEACLPADLRGPFTTITRIAAGLSDAGVGCGAKEEYGRRFWQRRISDKKDEPLFLLPNLHRNPSDQGAVIARAELLAKKSTSLDSHNSLQF
jgi:hypothetical protein